MKRPAWWHVALVALLIACGVVAGILLAALMDMAGGAVT